MVTQLMTSCDSKGQGRDPDIFVAQYLNNRGRYMVGSYWLSIGNRTLWVQWSHDWWRHVTTKGHGRDPNIISLISRKPCEIGGRFKFTTYRKLHIASPMVTWKMTSHPQKSMSWPQNLWGTITCQPFKVDGWFKLTIYRKPKWSHDRLCHMSQMHFNAGVLLERNNGCKTVN